MNKLSIKLFKFISIRTKDSFIFSSSSFVKKFFFKQLSVSPIGSSIFMGVTGSKAWYDLSYFAFKWLHILAMNILVDRSNRH
ncbi:hypothetical protein VNO80_11768 [Phaseolus coccineus]|uniref:Uncharacterized protein n=1 Tax=Phaseolus coccineus TaxID=3886 RepID=A0AAN9RBQ0_PHACN